MTENKLYSSNNNVTFNGQVVEGEVDNNDPMVTLTGYISKSMVPSHEAALRHRCKVQSDLRNIYRCVINEYVKNSKTYFQSTTAGVKPDPANAAGHVAMEPMERVNHDMKKFFECVNAETEAVQNAIYYAGHDPHQTVTPIDVTETILRGLLRKYCHYVGFAVGETRERLPKRDPVMAHDKLKNNHIAVNRGGNITVKADEQIDTGDYVLVDFDWKDFGEIWGKLEGEKVAESALSAFGPMKLKVKSFKKCAHRCLRVASRLKVRDDEIGNQINNDDTEYTQAQCVIRGCKINSDKLNCIDHPNFVKLFSSLAPSVIAQCKSGCTKGDASGKTHKHMIDIKLESHIDKRSFRLGDLDKYDEDNYDPANESQFFARAGAVTYCSVSLVYGKEFSKRAIDYLPTLQQNLTAQFNELREKQYQVNDRINTTPRGDPMQLTYQRMRGDIQNQIGAVQQKERELRNLTDTLRTFYAGLSRRWTLKMGPDKHNVLRQLDEGMRITGMCFNRMKELTVEYHDLLEDNVSEDGHNFAPTAAPTAAPSAAPAPPRESSTASPPAPTPAAPSTTTTEPSSSTTTEPSTTIAAPKKSKKKPPVGPK